MLKIEQDGQTLIELDADAGTGWSGREDAAAFIDAAAAGALSKAGPDIAKLTSRHAAATEATAKASRLIAELERERSTVRYKLFGNALTSRLSEIDAAVREARDNRADADGEADAVVSGIESLRGRLARECADAVRKAIKAKAPAVEATRSDAENRLRAALEDLLSRYTRAVATLEELRLANPDRAARETIVAMHPALFDAEGLAPFPVAESTGESRRYSQEFAPDEFIQTERERDEGTARARNWRGIR